MLEAYLSPRVILTPVRPGPDARRCEVVEIRRGPEGPYAVVRDLGAAGERRRMSLASVPYLYRASYALPRRPAALPEAA